MMPPNNVWLYSKHNNIILFTRKIKRTRAKPTLKLLKKIFCSFPPSSHNWYKRETNIFFSFCFQETLSRSCMIPGIAVKREQRSYSSLSRSQQRTAGMFGSRTVGTGGTGVAHESSDCSGISTRDECPQNKSTAGAVHAYPEQENFLASPGIKAHNGKYLLTKDSSGDLQQLQQNTASHVRYKEQSPTSNSTIEVRESLSRSRDNNTITNNTQCSAKKAPSQSNETRKKWWQFFKWMPGLKSMTLENRFMYAIPIRKEAKGLSNNREEYSMTVTNFNSSSLSAVDSRPVWNCPTIIVFEAICESPWGVVYSYTHNLVVIEAKQRYMLTATWFANEKKEENKKIQFGFCLS